MSVPSPADLVRAHQWLYYCVARPVLSDWSYDLYCDVHGIEGSGGSDCESSYTAEDRALAARLRAGTDPDIAAHLAAARALTAADRPPPPDWDA